MPRRTHRKSRNGCIECKRRHIKCDEKRPVCSHCTSSERECEYGPGFEPQIRRTEPPSTRSVSSQPQTPSLIEPTESDDGHQPVNMQHVELFYHLSTDVLDSFRPEFQGIDFPARQILKEVTLTPYLMNELLALAAIHRSTVEPRQEVRSFYLRQATELQTCALSIFNTTRPNVNAETCVPILIFSSSLGVHEMCKTLIFRETTFEPFMSKFVDYVSLHQGVKAVARGSWHLLRESILASFVKQGESSVADSGSSESGEVYQHLQSLLNSNGLSSTDEASCKQAISSLQSVLNFKSINSAESLSMNSILTWPIILDQGYTDLLRRRDPHALVILAHYGVMLHFRRDMWMCGDGGAFMVHLIAQHLGDQWSDWLAWPIQVVSQI